MRLLIDENLSEALIVSLHDVFPDSLHVRSLGNGGASDSTVGELARQFDCILLTRDEDFLRLWTAVTRHRFGMARHVAP